MENPEKIRPGFQINFWFLTIPLAIILAVYLFNTSTVSAINSFLAKKIAEDEEAARPANLEVTIIKDSSCGDCFDLTPAIEAIKKENVKITAEKTLEITDSEAMALINEFKIAKAPALILKGELAKNSAVKDLLQQLGEIQENTFVLTKTGAPYVLTDSGDVRGRVKFTMLADQKCTGCYDVTGHDTILQRFGLNTSNQQILDINSPEGKELVKTYKIKLVPTFVLAGDVSEFPPLTSIWSSVGTVEKDGTYVFREGVNQMGTYKDLSTGKIVTLEINDQQ